MGIDSHPPPPAHPAKGGHPYPPGPYPGGVYPPPPHHMYGYGIPPPGPVPNGAPGKPIPSAPPPPPALYGCPARTSAAHLPRRPSATGTRKRAPSRWIWRDRSRHISEQKRQRRGRRRWNISDASSATAGILPSRTVGTGATMGPRGTRRAPPPYVPASQIPPYSLARTCSTSLPRPRASTTSWSSPSCPSSRYDGALAQPAR